MQATIHDWQSNGETGMGLSSRTKRILWLTFGATAALAITVILRHRRETANTSTAPVFAEQTPTATAVQPGQSQSETAPNSSQPSQDDKAAFIALADTELSQLQVGVTLDQWTSQRSNGEIWEPSSDQAFSDCRSFEKTETLPSGRTITRAVYFYPPEAPHPAVFPDLSGQALINHTCTFAKVLILTPVSSRDDGHDLEQALDLHFAGRYGTSIGMEGTPFQWTVDAHRWMVAPREIVTVYDPQHAEGRPNEGTAGLLFVGARLPVVREIEEDSNLRVYRYRSIESAQFHQAIAIAGVEIRLSERMSNLFEEIFRLGRGATPPETTQQSQDMKWAQSLAPVLQDWLNAIKPLPPAKRAAGLYAADRLVAVAEDIDSEPIGQPKEPELRTALEKMNATFEFDELGNSYVYSSNWLKEAQELDPEGAVGQMAAMIYMARGGTGFNAKEHDVFRIVIADGERLLNKGLDAQTAAQVHFMVGDAYSDIVALAGGAVTDYGDPKLYEPEADSARKKALEHYRAGLAVDGTSENARDAWLQAWHLSAGLIPTTRYVYVYD